MKRIKAAAVQIAPDLTTRFGTVDRVCEAIGRAASQGVELAVFPETFIPYYPYFSFVAPAIQMGKDHLRLYEWAVEVPGPVTELLSKAASQHGMVLVVGVNERDGGSLYNTQLIFENAAKSRQPIMNAWFGDKETAPVSERLKQPSVASAHSRAGSITIHWRVSR